jgi:hypothetical protein
MLEEDSSAEEWKYSSFLNLLKKKKVYLAEFLTKKARIMKFISFKFKL